MTHETTRRRLLGASLATAASGLIFPRIAAAQDETPVGGGRLRAAFAGMGQAETLEPWNAGYVVSSFQRAQALYEPLVRSDNGGIKYVLAESMEPNGDGTLWTVRLRDGVTFHDGSPFTASDVLGTFAYHLDPSNASVYAFAIGFLDISSSRIVDDLTLELATVAPVGDLPDQLAAGWVFIFRAEPGDLAMTANGTGPFKLESFTPGDRAVLSRNENYWGPPESGPFLDTLEIISIDDPQTRLNALISGQIDFAENLTHAQATQLAGDDSIKLVRFDNQAGRAVLGFSYNVTQPPFDDPRVREGLALLIDRQGLIDSIALGFGEPANDLLFNRTTNYNDQLPQREHDPERAAFLFDDAGVEGAAFELWTSHAQAGYVESAILWADQLTQAGFAPEVTTILPDLYFTDLAAITAAPMKALSGGGSSVLSTIGSYYISTGFLNLSAYSNPRVDELYAQASATLDPDLRRRLAFDIQEEIWNDPPGVAWGALEVIHAAVAGLEGLDGSDTTLYPLFTGAWLAEV